RELAEQRGERREYAAEPVPPLDPGQRAEPDRRRQQLAR
ncbi:MAG: hypothetical protein AMXMBFR13_47310, partial [Phycisphaerae bacterium]